MFRTRVAFDVPQALQERIEAHREVDWDAIVANAVESRLQRIAEPDERPTQPMDMTDPEAELADEIEAEMVERFGVLDLP